MHIIVLVVAAPVIMLAISIIALVGAAMADGTTKFLVCRRFDANLALSVLVGCPVLLHCIGASAKSISMCCLLEVMS